MAKGIIYVMTTVVPGLIKIGKTGTANFEKRMYNLEKNGYSNVVGLKRYFAIEVEDYDEKEMLLDDIFSKSRLENTELFALDVNLVVQLLSSFEGVQVYPKEISKEETFDNAAGKRDIALLPDGTYFLNRKVKRWDNKQVTGEMRVKDGTLTLLKGSIVCPVRGVGSFADSLRKSLQVKDDVLQKDVEVSSPSAAAAILLYGNANGWSNWKTKDGKPIDIYRNKK